MHLKIKLNQVEQKIIIDNISVPATIMGEPGQRICVFEPNKEFWDFWRKYKRQVKQIAPSKEHAENWGSDSGIIKQLGPFKVWKNPYDNSYRGYYDELDLFKEHEKKWSK